MHDRKESLVEYGTDWTVTWLGREGPSQRSKSFTSKDEGLSTESLCISSSMDNDVTGSLKESNKIWYKNRIETKCQTPFCHRNPCMDWRTLSKATSLYYWCVNCENHCLKGTLKTTDWEHLWNTSSMKTVWSHCLKTIKTIIKHLRKPLSVNLCKF